MINSLTLFVDNCVKAQGLQRLQRWILSTRALSYNALILFNVWSDNKLDRIKFIEHLIEQQKPKVSGLELTLKEAIIVVADASDIEPFVCTTGLEKWCIRVHLTLLGDPSIYIDDALVKMPIGESVKIMFNSNLSKIEPKYNSRTVQLVTFWGTAGMPKIWDVTKN